MPGEVATATGTRETRMGPRETAEAFSGHRFGEAYGQLHQDVRWVVPGHEPMIGQDRRGGGLRGDRRAHGRAGAWTEFTRFVVVADDRVAAVDAIGRYVSHDGTTSVVSSADVYELDADGLVTTITSYAVELDE